VSFIAPFLSFFFFFVTFVFVRARRGRRKIRRQKECVFFSLVCDCRGAGASREEGAVMCLFFFL